MPIPAEAWNCLSRLPDAPIFHRLQESLGVFTTDAVDAEPDLTLCREFLGEDAGPCSSCLS
jgi:hypothetical protein